MSRILRRLAEVDRERQGLLRVVESREDEKGYVTGIVAPAEPPSPPSPSKVPSPAK